VETVFTLRTHFFGLAIVPPLETISIPLCAFKEALRENKKAFYPRPARVRAALRAARERPRRPLVRAARRAEAERWVRVRFRAAERACRESAFLDAARRGSRFSASSMALERRREVLGLRRWPA
jgi:hypothetical protein